MAELKRVRIPMPSSGMNTVAPPGEAPPGKGPLARNFLPEFPDKLVMRGPINGLVVNKSFWTLLTKTTPLLVTGWAVHNGKILIGYTESAGEAKEYIPDWKMPYLPSTTLEQFMTVAGVVIVDTVNGTYQAIVAAGEGAPLTNSSPGHNYVKLEGLTYYISAYSGGNTKDKFGFNNSPRTIVTWNGSVNGAVGSLGAPTGGQYLKAYLNRLWCLGGNKPGASNFSFVLLNNKVTIVTGNAFLTFFGTKVEAEELIPPSAKVRLKGKVAEFTTNAVYTELAPQEIKIGLTAAATETGTGLTTSVEVAYFSWGMNTLFFTIAGGPVTRTESDWKDPTTGLLNQIVIGNDEQNDFGVGLAIINQSMLIFKRKSVWALYGTSPESFTVRNLTNEFGCVDPHSILEANYGVYFASQRGLMYWNGESFTQVDDEISNVTIPLMEEVSGPPSVQNYKKYHGQINLCDVGNGYMMLNIVKQNREAPKGTVSSSFTAIMKYESGNWSEFTAGEGGLRGAVVPLIVDKVKGQPFVFDGDFVTDINEVTSVDITNINLDVAHAPNTAIPAKVQTDRIVLSTPGYSSQLHRVMQDYTWPNGASDAAAEPGWWWSLTDGDGTVIQEPVQLPGQGFTATKYLRGRRWEMDNFNEIVDGRLEIEWKASTLAIRSPELYDATFEFIITRQRRST